MAISEKVELNKSQNYDIEIPCTRCSGKTTHKVLTSVDVRGEETDGPYSYMQWCDDYQILECAGCKSKSFRNISSNS